MSRKPVSYQEFVNNVDAIRLNRRRPNESQNAWMKFLNEECGCRSRSTLQNILKAMEKSGSDDKEKVYEAYTTIVKERNDHRTKQEKKEEPCTNEQPEEQLPGQIEMDLDPYEEIIDEKQDMSERVKRQRFEAAQVDKLCMKLEKLNDTLSMILREVRKE